jgi:hypothetical protein
MLETVAALAAGGGRVAAVELLMAVLGARAAVVPTAHVARVLASVALGGCGLRLVLDGIGACPRAARMLLQIGPYVFSEPELSSAWLAAAAVVCRCAGELRTPTPVFARAKFLEKCWAHDSPLVRHYGMLVAAALCRLIGRGLRAEAAARECLPPPVQLGPALRKAAGEDAVALLVYGDYRSLFRREFEESRTDAIRIAMDAGYGGRPSALAHIVRACLLHKPDDALATLFHRHVFAALLREVAEVEAEAPSPGRGKEFPGEAQLLVRDIFLATRLFPLETQHEVEIWIAVATAAGQGAALVDFESFVAAAWSKPYALFDDLSNLVQASDVAGGAGHDPLDGRPFTSLLTAAALRRIDKLGGHLTDSKSLAADGSLGSLLVCALDGVCQLLATEALADSIGKRLIGREHSKILEQGRLSQVARRLQSREDGPGAVWDLVECVSKESASAVSCVMGRFVLDQTLKTASSPASRASVLSLLLRLACYNPAVAASLHNKVLKALCDGEDKEVAALFAASLLRAPIMPDVRHQALQSLCSGLGGGKGPSLPWKFAEFGRQAIADCLSEQSSGILEASRVGELLQSILAGRGDTGNSRFVLESLHQLLTHCDAQIRATAHLVVGDALESGTFCVDFASLTLSDALTLRALALNLPALRRNLLEYATNIANVSSTSIVVLPAVYACFFKDENEPSRPDVENQLAAVLLPSLLSASSFKDLVPASVNEDLLGSAEGVLARLLRFEQYASSSTLVTEFLSAKSEHWRNFPLDASKNTVSSVVLRTLFKMAPTNEVLIRLQPSLAGVLMSFPCAALAIKSSTGAELLGNLLEYLRTSKIVSALDMRRVERLEKCVLKVMTACAKRLCGSFRKHDSVEDQFCHLRIIVASFQLDLMVSNTAGEILSCLAGTTTSGAATEWLAKAVSLSVARLAPLDIDMSIAQSLTKLEGSFSEAGVYNGLSSAKDQSVFKAMESIASVLKSSGSRLKFLLPENRGMFFQVDSADVIGLLDARRLTVATDAVLRGEKSDTPSGGCDPCFALTVLRRAACEAVARPTVAILDLEMVARSGLIGLAVTGLASADESLRMLSYAALGALSDAVGPENGVARDAAAALYRDRRQLAFMLNLLRTSIRSPLEQILPLFATFFRLALPVVLRPTHGAYREVTRFLLRTPTHNVHDADALSCLLREETEECRILALDVLKHGLLTGDDHHVARRRHMYDTLLLFGSQLPTAVLAVLITIVGKAQGQVAADLIRGHGLLPWLMGKAFGANSLVAERLELLAELATVLPRGVLHQRYAPCFARTLEDLAMHDAAGYKEVANAAQAISRLVPTTRNQFDLPHSHRVFCLSTAVYCKSEAACGDEDEELVVKALLSSCPQDAETGHEEIFPATTDQRTATLAFAAAAVLRCSNLRSKPAVRSSLACLLLSSSPPQVHIWSVVAVLTVLPVAEWPKDLYALADKVPGSVPKDLGGPAATIPLERKLLVRVARLLLANGAAVTDERSRKRRKVK